MNDYELFPGAIVYDSVLNANCTVLQVTQKHSFQIIEHFPDADLQTYQYSTRLEKLQPIGLDSDWLTRLGLIMDDLGLYRIPKNQTYFVEFVEDMAFLCQEDIAIVNLLWVHQLQGIYIHLTGKLLTIENA